MSNLKVLEINFNNIKNDFNNHCVELHLAKIELMSIIAKLNKIINDQKNIGFVDIRAIDLHYASTKLLDTVLHEIDLQEKEEVLKSNI